MAVNIIDRQKAEALIQEQVINTIQQEAPASSAFMTMATKLPNMTSGITRMPVLSVMPSAYFVNGETGFKHTTKQEWENVYLNAAELAVIVPIPEAVLDDASFDIIGEITPRITEAIGERVDSAIIFGNGRPAEWGLDIVSRARVAGNNVKPGTSPDYYNLLLGEDGVISKVEATGTMVTGAIASMGMRAKLRGIKTTDGYPIFKADMQSGTNYTLDGAPITFPQNGSFDSNVAQLVVGDFSKAVYAIRQDITVKILDQGVIQDPSSGDIIYNLAQQDMVALRVVFRMGWALPNPATRMNDGRANVPFAYLEPATAQTTQTVTLTVEDSSAQAVKGATVVIDGAKLVADASGKVEAQLVAGDYNVSVKADGFKAYNTTVTVADAAVTQTITLTAK
jgi:HK97 family phage major capsid protein